MKNLTHSEKVDLITEFLNQHDFSRQDLADHGEMTLKYLNYIMSPNYYHSTPKWMHVASFILQNLKK